MCIPFSITYIFQMLSLQFYMPFWPFYSLIADANLVARHKIVLVLSE